MPPSTRSIFICNWLLTGPEYLRENAEHLAQKALDFPDERASWLADLEAWVGFHWNYNEHEAVSDHTRSLRERITYDDIERADWWSIAKTLLAVEKEAP